MGEREARNQKIVEDYLAKLRRGAAEPKHAHDYLDVWSEDIEYILPGLWPLGGRYESKADYLERGMPNFDPDYGKPDDEKRHVEGNPGAGLYGYEYICDGNIVAATARSRGRDARGYPDTNTYFLWFELNDDGKIERYLDSADFSSAWQAFWGVRLE